MNNSIIDKATIVALLISLVLPQLVALVTTRVTNSSVKGGLLALLSILTAVLTQLGDALANDRLKDFHWSQVVVSAALTWGLAHTSYASYTSHLPFTDKLKDSLVTPKLEDGAFNITTLEASEAVAELNAPLPIEPEDLEDDGDPDGFHGGMADLTGGNNHLDEHPDEAEPDHDPAEEKHPRPY